MKKTQWVCAECGSNHVQMLAWVDANTLKYVSDGPGEKEDCWCEECDEHVQLKLVEVEVLDIEELCKDEGFINFVKDSFKRIDEALAKDNTLKGIKALCGDNCFNNDEHDPYMPFEYGGYEGHFEFFYFEEDDTFDRGNSFHVWVSDDSDEAHLIELFPDGHLEIC